MNTGRILPDMIDRFALENVSLLQKPNSAGLVQGGRRIAVWRFLIAL
jgi:hypothetical protein